MSPKHSLSPSRRGRDEPLIVVPVFGMTVRMRYGPGAPQCMPTVIETTHADGGGPPLHRRAESEIFEIVTGRFLFEVNGQRFMTRRGDLVSVPAGATRAYVNVTGTPARQQVYIDPGIDAIAFFEELNRASYEQAVADALNAFSVRWGVEFLAPPLQPRDADVPGGLT